MSSFLYWHDYRYFPYEKEMAQREATSLSGVTAVQPGKSGLQISGAPHLDELKRLVYFQKFTFDGQLYDTLQYKLEHSCIKTGAQRKQTTRYSVHGLHEYKGKFNPQIVRGIANLLGIQPGQTILDPFCGSGTTLVEAGHGQFNAVGVDVNPLAVFISNAKLQAQAIPASTIRKALNSLLDDYPAQIARFELNMDGSPRSAYLHRWFDDAVLKQIEFVRHYSANLPEATRHILLAIFSDLLRDYSQQEPADLRIRQRRTPLPEKPLLTAFREKASYFLDNLEAAQRIIPPQSTNQNRAYLGDIRLVTAQDWPYPPPYEAAITSPPYATALPYIDTQRLSLVWLNLSTPQQIKSLEASLTGSREFIKAEKQAWAYALHQNQHALPEQVHAFCRQLESALLPDDGFRRQAVPYLMYRYFSHMQAMFQNMHTLLQLDAPFALVVGHNHTMLGRTRFDIDTPAWLKIIAVHSGFAHQESIPLQTYQRYSIHQANAVQMETLLILRRL
ncbi:MAG: RNA methylase [Anaerolineae bacterium]|nr:RNA methylase [Anaerolineae bacterium]